MNSQNDNYLKHSPHWIYADLCSWNTGRGQNENKEFENCNYRLLDVLPYNTGIYLDEYTA